MAAELYGAAPAAWIVSVGAANFELGEPMSAAVEAALPDRLHAVNERAFELGRRVASAEAGAATGRSHA